MITKQSQGGATSHGLPHALLSLSQASHVLTPSLCRLAQVSTINRAFGADSPVLFGYSVVSVSAAATENGLKLTHYIMTLQKLPDGDDGTAQDANQIQILAKCVMDCRGLGEPLFPTGVHLECVSPELGLVATASNPENSVAMSKG